MNRKTASYVMLTLLLMSMIGLTSNLRTVTASLSVHNIDTGEDFASIQEAIDDADTLDGHTILVDIGIYYETLEVDKSLTFIGEDDENTIVDGCGERSVFGIVTDNVTIDGFTVRNSGYEELNVEEKFPSPYYSCGIYVIGVKGITITNNNVLNNGMGIVLAHVNSSTLTNNTVEDNIDRGVWFAGGCTDVILRNNTIANNPFNFGVGVFGLVDSLHDIDTSNTVNGKPICYWVNQHDREVPADAGYVAIVNSTNVSVRDLTLTNNVHGVELIHTADTIIENITASQNDLGIYLRVQAMNNTITGSNLFNNTYGIGVVGNSSGSVIHCNEIFSNLYGVLSKYTNGSRIYHNNIVNNVNQTKIEMSAEIWDNGAEGNYWSDYTGEDLDGDGIGDTLLPHQEVDWYPLVEPWSSTRTFNATKNEETYQINILSNSTIASFHYNSTLNEMSFNATGPTGTTGFCNMTVPKELGDTFQVLVDGVPVSYSQTENATHYFLYFTYLHSTHIISIVINPSPSKLVEKLIADVKQMNLQQGIDNSLDAKLEATLGALEALNAEQRSDAVNKLNAFINEVEAQRGKKLTDEQADYLAVDAQKIVDLIHG